MICVREIFGAEAVRVCQKLSVSADETDRVFALCGEGVEGVGLMRFQRGAVRIREFVSTAGGEYTRLLLLTMLNDLSARKGLRVVIEKPGDYARYGFKKTQDGYFAVSEDIVFPHECKGEL